MKKSRSTPFSDGAKTQPVKISAPKTKVPKSLRVIFEEKAPNKAVVSASIDSKPETPVKSRVSFELIKPGAKSVCVAGTFNDWRPEKAPLVATSNGRWVGDLTLQPGRHEYLFVVDGQWIPDPNAKESVQNPFGGRNSIIGVYE